MAPDSASVLRSTIDTMARDMEVLRQKRDVERERADAAEALLADARRFAERDFAAGYDSALIDFLLMNGDGSNPVARRDSRVRAKGGEKG